MTALRIVLNRVTRAFYFVPSSQTSTRPLHSFFVFVFPSVPFGVRHYEANGPAKTAARRTEVHRAVFLERVFFSECRSQLCAFAGSPGASRNGEEVHAGVCHSKGSALRSDDGIPMGYSEKRSGVCTNATNAVFLIVSPFFRVTAWEVGLLNCHVPSKVNTLFLRTLPPPNLRSLALGLTRSP